MKMTILTMTIMTTFFLVFEEHFIFLPAAGHWGGKNPNYTAALGEHSETLATNGTQEPPPLCTWGKF